MGPNPQETTDLVTFTEEILNGKFHFLCSVCRTANKSKLRTVFCAVTFVYYTALKNKVFH